MCIRESDVEMSPRATQAIKRYDSDTALNYSINRYIKLFGGAKAMGYSWKDGSHYGVGPALGIGLTLPLSASLFLLGNLSGLYGFMLVLMLSKGISRLSFQLMCV